MTTNHEDQALAQSLPREHAIAYHLASMACSLPGFGNADRDSLYRVADLLRGSKPDTEEARATALRGVSRAIGPGFIEQRPETWLLCAIVLLLSLPHHDAAAAPFPTSEHLSTWCDLMGTINDELIDPEAPAGPARGGAEAVLRSTQLTMLRLWLLQCFYLRAQSDSGMPSTPTPGEPMPIGNVGLMQ